MKVYTATGHLCYNCGLSKTRKSQVVARGRLPCDVLFVGEAPGRSEDLLGKPFCGPAGRVLDKLIGEIGFESYAITNAVQCYPTDSEGNTREPSKDEVAACMENFKRVLDKARPKQTVLLGKVANKYLRKYVPNPTHVYHPAYLLRRGLDSYEYMTTLNQLTEVYHAAKTD